MKFLRRHWYNVGLAIAIIAAIFLAWQWSSMCVLQRILLLNFIAICIHTFEEYGFPGGEPAVMNIALRPSQHPTNCYPINQNNAMIINFIGYIYYLIPVFFPNIFWLAMGPVLFGFGQIVIHGIQTPKKLGQFYNPGLGAVLLGHLPIGIAYIYFAYQNLSISPMDWVFSVACTLFIVFTVAFVGHKLLADPNSPYPVSDEEMKRFNVQEKLDKLKAKRKK